MRVTACLLGLTFVAGILAVAREGVLRRMDWMWLGTLTFGLLALASTIPDLAIALGVAWIALHPYLLPPACRRGWIPGVPVQAETYRYLWCVGGWVTVYLVCTHLTAPDLLRLAQLWVGWAALNALSLAWLWLDLPRPRWWKQDLDKPPCGMCGGTWFVSYCICLGILSAVFLGGWWLVAIPPLAVTLPLPKHYMAPISLAVALTWEAPGFTWKLLAGALALGIVALKIRQRHRGTMLRLKRWDLLRQIVILSHGIGVGLGGLNLLAPQDEEEYRAGGVFANSHNDWLQALAELGPLPVLCAVAEVTRRLLWTPHAADATFATALVLFTAVLAIPYFPFHHPAQALVAALALGYRG